MEKNVFSITECSAPRERTVKTSACLVWLHVRVLEGNACWDLVFMF
jgi:hypothetical protein